ncbi:MAG: FIST N-terminal domain-containing protein [Actinomycetota bacterium]
MNQAADDSGADRWMLVGQSGNPDAWIAGTEAAGQVAGPDVKLLLLFCSESYDLEQLLAAVNQAAGGAALIGCSTSGEIATNGPSESSVVLTAFGGSGFNVGVSCAVNASENLRSAGALAAGAIDDAGDMNHKILLILSDGLAGDQQEIVRGAYSVVGATVPLVGGCAGDDLKMRATYQFFGDQVLTNAVVAAAVGSDSPFGIGVRHGWRTVGDPMVVTSSNGREALTLDDTPALDAYIDRLKAPPQARTDPDEFIRFAMTHPLGLSGRTTEPHARYVAEADFDRRALICIAEVPEGTLAWIMEGDDASVLEATDTACTQALTALGDRQPVGVLAFDCIARRGVLGEAGIKNEIDRIGALCKGVPIAGFYTYGEIARTNGIGGFHNQTLVVLAVS